MPGNGPESSLTRPEECRFSSKAVIPSLVQQPGGFVRLCFAGGVPPAQGMEGRLTVH